jgi:lysine 6-dehydrogenase
MRFSYLVLGAGRQGTAAAYDLGRFGEAERLVLADLDARKARVAAGRVNRLVGRTVARPQSLDVRDPSAAGRWMDHADVVLSAVPYFFNLELTRVAIDAGASFVDLGGNTSIVLKQLSLDEAARKAGIAVLPDCGMGPGLNLTLAVRAMELLDTTDHVYIFDGGLPQDPTPPWGYALTFNVEGLTNEYSGTATFLRDGKPVSVPALTEFEEIDVPPLGRLEAMTTSGGLSAAPWTFQGRLTTLQNKTLRYPGHWSRMRAYADLGLFDMRPREVDGRLVVPRHVFHALFEPLATPRDVRDVCVEHIRAVGARDGRPAEAYVDLVDYYDPATEFTSMERLTGWHAAIAAGMIARGEIGPGAHSVEVGIPAGPFIEQARQRGLRITERIGYLDGTQA